MRAIEIFSSSVKYKYKTTLCSISTFLVTFICLIIIVAPVYIIYHAGGFWLKSRTYHEIPKVNFKHKYLLIAEKETDANPIICSSFVSYKGNELTDDCLLIKAREIDSNKNGLKDKLKFEARFFSDTPIRSIKILLFFNHQLKKHVQVTMETMGVLDISLIHDVQKIYFLGDLILRQKGLLRHDGLYNLYNSSFDGNLQSLSQLLSENSNRMFSARIVNSQVTWQSGFLNSEEILLEGEIFYTEQSIRYQPGILEELKWAWMQYLSLLLILIFLGKRSLTHLFSSQYLRSYVLIPWEKKNKY